MENFEERLDRLMTYLRDNYTIDDVKVYDILESGIRYLYDNVEYQTDWGFAHIIYKALLESTRFGISENEVWEAWMNVIYESEELLVKSTGHDYDFIATLEINDSEFSRDDMDLVVVFTDEYKDLDAIQIPQGDWVGLLADEEGYRTLKAIRKHKFYTMWEDVYKEEQL